MQLNPYGEDALRFAVGLVEDPPVSRSQLARRCRDAGLAVGIAATDRDLTRLEAFLRRWTEVVDAADEKERADRLNVMLARYAAHPRLTNHTGDGWHLHHRDDHLDLADVVAALVSVGTAMHLTGRGMHRLGRCVLPECHRIVADMSRNGRQRYCSPVCANRDAVRRHRARASRGGTSPATVPSERLDVHSSGATRDAPAGGSAQRRTSGRHGWH
jgi:predicted RNA-binding Zn ribbon-like protein